MQLIINKAQLEVTHLDELRLRLAQVRLTQFSEVWIYHIGGWPALCALVNGEAGWLMYMRFAGDAGFSTRDPRYAGPERAVIQYRLANGQCDEYPTSWNITTPEAIRGLEFFFEKAAMAPWLHWHDDTQKQNI